MASMKISKPCGRRTLAGAGGFVFCSGTAGSTRRPGSLADGIAAQTEQALLNLAAILQEAGASMADLVKTTILSSLRPCGRSGRRVQDGIGPRSRR
jgi:enamine deaminase RidA (YjgF/YER057c/UK114 family)